MQRRRAILFTLKWFSIVWTLFGAGLFVIWYILLKKPLSQLFPFQVHEPVDVLLLFAPALIATFLCWLLERQWRMSADDSQ
jgi:hypothetical protein